MPAFKLLSRESAPRVGPTDLFSITLKDTGKAPERSWTARLLASSAVKWPEITALPSLMGSFTLGALMTSSSITISKGFPTLAKVASANSRAPVLSNSSKTSALPVPERSIRASAFLRFSPVTHTFPVSSWNSSWATFFKISTAASGSSSPAISITTRLSPWGYRVVSFTPKLSTRVRKMPRALLIVSSVTALPSVS